MARGRFIDRSRYAYPTTLRDAQRKQQDAAQASAAAAAGAAASFDPSLADQLKAPAPRRSAMDAVRRYEAQNPEAGADLDGPEQG